MIHTDIIYALPVDNYFFNDVFPRLLLFGLLILLLVVIGLAIKSEPDAEDDKLPASSPEDSLKTSTPGPNAGLYHTDLAYELWFKQVDEKQHHEKLVYKLRKDLENEPQFQKKRYKIVKAHAHKVSRDVYRYTYTMSYSDVVPKNVKKFMKKVSEGQI